MSVGCPTCGDTLQGVMCEVPDHGTKRDLMIDWCMDCLEAKRFTLGTPKPTEPRHPANPLARQEGGDHYKRLKIQPIEYIHANGIPFAEGSVIKYVTRWRDKGGVKDLEKARHFLDLLIELETRGKEG